MSPSDLKYAIVKQDCFEDLYCCYPKDDPKTKILSTIYRIGPASLFTRYNADMYIVEEEQDDECQEWKHKISPDPNSRYQPSHYRKFAARHKPFTRKCTDVDWGQYDVVISMDVSVPARITRKYPKTLWCYMLSDSTEGGVTKGYDVRFTQLLGGAIARSGHGYRLNYPYTSVEPRYLLQLTEPAPPPIERKGMFKEPRSFNLDLAHPDNDRPRPEFDQKEYDAFSKLGPIRAGMHPMMTVDQDGNDLLLSEGGIRTHAYDRAPEFLRVTLKNMSLSKYWIKTSGRLVRGNNTIEAISCRCLAVGPPSLLIHNELFHEDAKTSDGGITIRNAIQKFDNNSDLFIKALDWQDSNMNYLAIQKPMESITRLYREKTSK